MNKLLLVCLTLLLGFALFVPQAIAKKPDPVEKVDLCHIIAANDVVPFLGGNDLYFGKVVSVSGKALEAHLSHGDLDCFFTNQGAIDTFREFGAHLPAANCYIGLHPNGEFYGPQECTD